MGKKTGGGEMTPDLQVRAGLAGAKRIVVKVGSSTLTHDNGFTHLARMDRLALALAELMNNGHEVVLVTSGAIAVGMGKFQLERRPAGMGMKQALAAVGQCELMNLYSRLLSAYNRVVAQVLLTKTDLEDETRSRNILNTFSSLFQYGVLPIVNENDTVSVEEIKSLTMFGDNDTLSAVVARLIGADLLILLSDIDGFYDANPRENPDSRLIATVHEITDAMRACAGGSGTARGTGGMQTKLNAAELATNAGCHMVLANGDNPLRILDILDGKPVGTLFVRKPASNNA
jgi:glutamate 5-kinase